MLRSIASTFTVLLLLAAPATARAADPEHVDVAGAEALLGTKTEIVVLDVRTPGEFEAIHLAGAKNIDIDGASFREDAAKLDRDQAYLVHCAAGIPGGRSARSVEILEELGFTRVYHLDGGINAWKAAGKGVEGTAAGSVASD
ncbi:MAG: rhodanese-like domain-containing protein [Candidatus Binatia bacterium]|nr:rhodanese-like domain-containing protein [Candidatus Binatia bacterium]